MRNLVPFERLSAIGPGIKLSIPGHCGPLYLQRIQKIKDFCRFDDRIDCRFKNEYGEYVDYRFFVNLYGKTDIDWVQYYNPMNLPMYEYGV